MGIFKTYFDTQQVTLLILSGVFALLSIYFFEYKKQVRIALIFLLLVAITIRIFAALLDPFFNLWDEQYHALVAKSMMQNPFKPMLYTNPALPYDSAIWTSNHIWLHKQPLFLWQIALSFKTFGISPFTFRLPGIIMMAVLTYFVYDSANYLFNKRVAFYAALLISFSNYQLLLLAGSIATDQNDIAFMFYITASFWAYLRYLKQKKWKWAIFTGIFSGMAVLNKWLPGLMIFEIWFVYAIISKQFNRKSIFDFLLAVFVAFVIFVPWQIYILNAFPAESHFEYALNRAHFTDVIEGHGGSFWYHFQVIGNSYGIIFWALIPISLIVSYFTNQNKKLYLSILLLIISVYLFYSIARTKMPAFTFILSPIIFILVANTLVSSFNKLENVLKNNKRITKAMFTGCVVVLLLLTLNIEKIQAYHTNWKPRNKWWRNERASIVQFVKENNLDKLNKNSVIFNIENTESTLIMLYSECTAYDFTPTQEQLDIVKEKGFDVWVLNRTKLPDYIQNDSSIVKIQD